MKKDKKQHIFCGIIAAIVVGFLTYLVSGEVAAERNIAAGVYAALAGGFVAAAVKEFCDKGYSIDPSKWDWRDIGCTVFGAAIVALFIVGMHFAKG